MTVKEFLDYLECQPIPEEELLKREICFRFQDADGQCNHVVRPKKIAIEDVEKLGDKQIVVTMNIMGSPYKGETPMMLCH